MIVLTAFFSFRSCWPSEAFAKICGGESVFVLVRVMILIHLVHESQGEDTASSRAVFPWAGLCSCYPSWHAERLLCPAADGDWDPPHCTQDDARHGIRLTRGSEIGYARRNGRFDGAVLRCWDTRRAVYTKIKVYMETSSWCMWHGPSSREALDRRADVGEEGGGVTRDMLQELTDYMCRCLSIVYYYQKSSYCTL